MESLLRFLELVRRELSADDARLEIGGREPDPERSVWAEFPDGSRVVAVFDGQIEDRDETQERLSLLVGSFDEAARPELPVGRAEAATRRELDGVLDELVRRSGAEHVLVVDESSPVVWASTLDLAPEEDVDWLLEAARLARAADEADEEITLLLEMPGDATDPDLAGRARRLRGDSVRAAGVWRKLLVTASAVHALRNELARATSPPPKLMRRDGDPRFLARGFGGSYYLLLAFAGAFSELHADAATVKALPIVERLVLALPPVDPPPKTAKVIRLPRRG